MPQVEQLEVSGTAELEQCQGRTAEVLKRFSEPLQVENDRPVLGRTGKDILIAVAVALAMRIPYFRWRMFPLNDGGMFAQIIEDIRAAHFILPTHTTYNFLDIPLAYPPLAFYLGALCTALPGQNAVQVLTWLPLVLNLITVVLLYFIAKEIYPAKYYACLAACCYAAIGRSGSWLTMGGGLTRGLGILFGLAAILVFLRARKRNITALAILSGFFIGLAIWSHLEGGIFAALSLMALSVLLPNRLQNIRIVAFAGAISVVLISPWVVWLYRHLGFGPLINAAATGGSFLSTLAFPNLLLLAAAIIIVAAVGFPYFCWFMVLVIFMPRSGLTYAAPVAAIGIVWLANAVITILLRPPEWQRFRTIPVITAALTFALLDYGTLRVRRDRLEDLRTNARAQLSIPELEAMRAAARLTPPNAKFFVYSERLTAWAGDMVAEWFPYVAKRQCLNTVQGREWLPNGAFSAAILTGLDLELSGTQRVTNSIMEGLKPDYIFIAGPLGEDQQMIANTLRVYAKSSPIFQNSEVTIYKVDRSQSPDSPKTSASPAAAMAFAKVH